MGETFPPRVLSLNTSVNVLVGIIVLMRQFSLPQMVRSLREKETLTIRSVPLERFSQDLGRQHVFHVLLGITVRIMVCHSPCHARRATYAIGCHCGTRRLPALQGIGARAERKPLSLLIWKLLYEGI